MNKNPLLIKHLQSGGLITNYFCSSQCRHCLYKCGPKWPKEYIDEKTTRNNFNVIKRLGCNSVHIGGGEPLLRTDLLLKVLECASQEKVTIEYIETNSSWYRDHHTACRIIEQLMDHGVTTLLISISPMHNEYIPFFKVKGVIRACNDIGCRVFPWITDFYHEIDRLDEKKTHWFEEYETVFGSDYNRSVVNRYWLSPGGRALDMLAPLTTPMPTDTIIGQNRGGCTQLSNTSHFHIDCYGNYIPGLCTGLSIHREDLGRPLDSSRYPVLSKLYNGGVGALYSYAKETHGIDFANKKFSHKCALCYSIRQSMVNDYNVASPELQPVDHYLM